MAPHRLRVLVASYTVNEFDTVLIKIHTDVRIYGRTGMGNT